MSDIPAIPNRGPGRRPLASKPERIDIGTDVLVRDDVLAAERGVSKRTQARADAKGAPFIMIGGVKYRPLRDYNEFTATAIVRKKPSPERRKHNKRGRS